MLIGEVAVAADVNVQTLRFYERRGLLSVPRRTDGGYRDYDDEAVAILRFIKRAQSVGFTLEEIRELLRLRERPRRDCSEVEKLAPAKLDDVKAKLKDLRSLKRALTELAAACQTAGEPLRCALLEALEGTAVAKARHGRTASRSN